MMRTQLPCIYLLTAALLACGKHGGESAVPNVSQNKQADVEYCSPLLIAWANPNDLDTRCMGPWGHMSGSGCPDEFDCFEFYIDPGHTRREVDDSFPGTNVCLTRDDMPIGPGSPSQDKHDALKKTYDHIDGLPGYVDKTTLRRQVVSNMKVLFELQGATLMPLQARTSLRLYPQFPTYKYLPCSGWPAPQTGCDLTDLNAVMDECYRASTLIPLPSEIAQDPEFFNACADSAVAIGQVSLDPCQGQTYRDAYFGFMLEFLRRAGANLRANEQGQIDLGDLRAQLTRIGRWHGDALPAFFPSAPPDESFWVKVSQAAGDLWTLIYDKAQVSTVGADGGLPDPEQIIQLFQHGLETDRSVLDGTFPPVGTGAPLSNAPLLIFMGDAFKSMTQRLATYTAMHDIACEFKTSQNGGACTDGVRTELTQLWRLLAAVPRKPELDTVLAASSGLTGQRWLSWKAIFQRISDQHQAFEDAVKDALRMDRYDPDVLSAPPPSATDGGTPLDGIALPSPLLLLSQIIRDARSRVNHYETEGLLQPHGKNVLHRGIQKQQRDWLLGHVTTINGQLTSAISEYRLNRSQWASDVLQQMRGQQQANSLGEQIVIKSKQFLDVSSDLTGLRRNYDIEEARYGDFLSAYNQEIDGGVDLDRRIERTLQSLDVSSSDSHYHSQTVTQNVNDIAVIDPTSGQAWKIEGGRDTGGNMLNITISGTWRPTCALQNSTLRVPPDGGVAEFAPIDTSTAEVGPEGFQVHWDNTRYVARGNENVNQQTGYYTDGTRNETICNTGYTDRPDTHLTNLSVYVKNVRNTAEECTVHERGISWRNGGIDTWGDDTRWAASFSTGLRLGLPPQLVPFPSMPVGALLLVKSNPGSTLPRDVKDVQVLQKPYSHVLFNEPADAYLVVNDSNNDCTLGGGHLTLEMTYLRPVGAFVQQMGTAMSGSLSDLRSSRERLMAQGRILPSELSAMREAAFTSLYNACGHCDLAQFPKELLDLFSVFVSKALANLDRSVEIQNVERARDAVLMEIEATGRDLTDTQDQGRLQRLMPAWTIKNLDGQHLWFKINDVTSLAVDELYPVADLRYPALFGSLTMSEINPLLTLPWDLPVDQVGDTVVRAVEEIKSKLGQPNLTPYYTVIRAHNSQFQDTSNWHKVDEETAQKMFADLERVKTGELGFLTFSINPADLYFDGASAAQFNCSTAVPVIRSMGLFFVRLSSHEVLDDPFLNAEFITVPIHMNSNLGFPDVGVLKNYQLISEDFGNPTLDVQWVRPSAAINSFIAREMTYEGGSRLSANGLSSFTTFDLNIGGLRTFQHHPLDDIEDILLVFSSEVREVSGLHLGPMCR